MKGYNILTLLLTVTVASADQELDVRLVNSDDTYTRAGRLEVFKDGEWGSVCDANFGINEGTAVCKQSGYASGAYRVRRLSMYGEGTGSMWLTDLKCTGTEASLADCTGDSWVKNGCDPDEVISVICKGTRVETREEHEDWEFYYMRELLREEEALKEWQRAEEAEEELRDADDALAKKSLEAMVDLLDRLNNN